MSYKVDRVSPKLFYLFLFSCFTFLCFNLGVGFVYLIDGKINSSPEGVIYNITFFVLMGSMSLIILLIPISLLTCLYYILVTTIKSTCKKSIYTSGINHAISDQTKIQID